MTRYRVSMDIGGTFTDVVTYDDVEGVFAATKTRPASAPSLLSPAMWLAKARMLVMGVLISWAMPPASSSSSAPLLLRPTYDGSLTFQLCDGTPKRALH